MFAHVERSNHDWIWIEASFVRGDGGDGDYNGTATFTAPNNILTFQLVRCSSGTTIPNWATTGDASGRIYNNTGNHSVSSGVYSYQVYDWSEHNPS